MSHTPPIFIKYGKNSSAFLTLDNPTNLVVFVHGFSGSATGTWNEFPSIIRNNNDFINSDVIFYGYESLKGQANNNAVKFYNFLKSVVENSSNNLGFTRENIDKEFKYEKIIIVAHSLGAIIVRRGLLNAKSENKNWLDKCKMVLFAPAHRGARVQKILASLPVVGQIITGLGYLAKPILDDLRPDSQTILNLIADSQNYLNQNNGDFTIAHTVVWANNEIIVHNDTFCDDPVASVIDHKSHTTVCKPKLGVYLDPYTIVLNAI